MKEELCMSSFDVRHQSVHVVWVSVSYLSLSLDGEERFTLERDMNCEEDVSARCFRQHCQLVLNNRYSQLRIAQPTSSVEM